MTTFYIAIGWLAFISAIGLMFLGDPKNGVGHLVTTALLAFLFAEINEIKEGLK